MKKLFVLSLLIASFLLSCQNQTSTATDTEPTATETTGSDTPPTYDEALATRLGADDYGMKVYIMAYLKRGPNRDRSPEEAAALQRAHMDNIGRLAEEGKLVLAGPYGDDGDIRGIYIFDVATIEEARALTETDPAIQAGSLEMELRQWYGTAALGLLNEWHPKIAKKEI
ncbi:MAG: YciI family protein [Bacteroidota bacterium]